MPSFNQQDFRAQFPLLTAQVNNRPLIYFDNGATTQKPKTVIDAYAQFYQTSNANVHRASHAISALATTQYEAVRTKLKSFIHAKYLEEIIWTKGTTDSINLIAQTWGRKNIGAGDKILLSQSEHHANIVPWQILAEQTGAIIQVLPLTKSGHIDTRNLSEYINERTKLVSIAHISNVIGKLNPVKEIIVQAKTVGAVTVIDGAQMIAHQVVDVQRLDCDFYVFSAHKMYGPTGVGVLYGKKDLLETMPVYQGGGEMIANVSFEGTTYNKLPFKFEPGTPNIAGVIAFGEALDFMAGQPREQLLAYEKKITQYCFEQLSAIEDVNFIAEQMPDAPILSFSLPEHHNHDIASAFDGYGIAIRSGHHCAMPLMSYLKLGGCLRISLAPYNTIEEIDYCIKVLKNIISEQGIDDRKPTNSESYVNHDDANHSNSVSHSKNAEAEHLIDVFSQCKGWDQRHREIMLLGKTLLRMDKNLRSEQTLISGCESLAWLSYQQKNDGRYHFEADSDAKVIRGLLKIVLTAFDNKTSQQVISFDLDGYFSKLGLMQHLSPSRGNGLQAIVVKIYQVVNEN